MALEIIGMRILASFFGYSVFVWGTIIGIVLVSLSIGYWLGGILADICYSYATIYKLILGSVLYLLVGIIAYPYFLEFLSESSFLFGLIVSTCLLLVPPSVLLSMVPPISTKALLKKKDEGKTIGNVYAISNVGSILGTFITTFYLLPYLGSRNSMILCVFAMAFFIVLGFWLEKISKKKVLLVAILIAFFSFIIFNMSEPITNRTLLKVESIYNTIEVREIGQTRWLLLNGHPMSYYEKKPTITNYFYDALAVFPKITGAKNILILGFATGTIANKTSYLLPNTKIEGVEIDPDVVKIAREYFGLRESEKVRVFIDDARHFVKKTDGSYDIIINNTINAKFIPFHLVTKEFFEQCDKKLSEKGVMINYSMYSEEKTMIRDSIAKTMCQVFPSVFYLNFPNQQVSLVFGFKEKTTQSKIEETIEEAMLDEQSSDIKQLMQHIKQIREFDCSSNKGEIITDDKNPVDNITLEQII
ncbi:MAG: fused MFS/spermidine synthase [Candidatus Diapherotrites archaeon]